MINVLRTVLIGMLGLVILICLYKEIEEKVKNWTRKKKGAENEV